MDRYRYSELPGRRFDTSSTGWSDEDKSCFREYLGWRCRGNTVLLFAHFTGDCGRNSDSAQDAGCLVLRPDCVVRDVCRYWSFNNHRLGCMPDGLQTRTADNFEAVKIEMWDCPDSVW